MYILSEVNSPGKLRLSVCNKVVPLTVPPIVKSLSLSRTTTPLVSELFVVSFTPPTKLPAIVIEVLVIKSKQAFSLSSILITFPSFNCKYALLPIFKFCTVSIAALYMEVASILTVVLLLP